MVSRILDEATPIADAIEDAVDAMTSDCPSDTFACDANDITLASLGIAAGAASNIATIPAHGLPPPEVLAQAPEAPMQLKEAVPAVLYTPPSVKGPKRIRRVEEVQGLQGLQT